MQPHGGALPRRAFDLYPPAGLAHKAVDHRQPQPAAAPGLFGGEERFKDPGLYLLRHPAAVVDHLQRHHVLPAPVAAGHTLVPGADFDRPTLPFHCIAGVHDQVNDGVFQLADVNPRGPCRGLRFDIQHNRCRQGVAHQLGQVFQQGLHLHRVRVQGLLAGKRQQTLGQQRSAFGGLQRAADARGIRRMGIGQLQATDDHRQQVVEIMRQSAR